MKPDYLWTPFTFYHKGACVLAPEATWDEPLEWNRQAKADLPTSPVAVPCPIVRVTVDPFAPHDGPIVNKRGGVICKPHNSDFLSWSYGDEGLRRVGDWLPLTFADVLAKLFALWDSTLNLQWLIETEWPQNVRTNWPDVRDEFRCICGLCSLPPQRVRDNVTIVVPVDGQREADERIPSLLELRDLVPTLALIYSGVEPLNLLHITTNDHRHSLGSWCNALAGCFTDSPTIDRVIIRGEIGPNARPCNLANVRDVMQQCDEAGVECVIERLGSSVRGTWKDFCDTHVCPPAVDCKPTTMDTWTIANPIEQLSWPPDLRQKARER